MTQLPLPDAIDRFKENEERIDTFVNGDENASYEQIGGGDDVPSVQKFLADKDAEINVAAEGILEQTSEQRALAQAWAESATAPDIGDPTSKSAKTWAEMAGLDRVQTGLDRAATAADRVATGTAAEQSIALSSPYTETDAAIEIVTVPAGAKVITRLPTTESAGQVAPVGLLTWWKRTTPPTSEPYFTTAGGVVWTQTALREQDVLSTLQSAIAGAFTDPSYAGVQPFASRAAFLAATIPASVTRTAFVVEDRAYPVIRDAAGSITQTDGTKWRPDGAATPQHYGASTGATGAANLTAFTACIAAHSDTIVPVGVYTIGGQIRLAGFNKTLRGESQLARATLSFEDNFDGPSILFEPSDPLSTGMVSGNDMANITLGGNASTRAGRWALDIRKQQHFRLSNVRWSGFSYGVRIAGGQLIYLDNFYSFGSSRSAGSHLSDSTHILIQEAATSGADQPNYNTFLTNFNLSGSSSKNIRDIITLQQADGLYIGPGYADYGNRSLLRLAGKSGHAITGTFFNSVYFDGVSETTGSESVISVLDDYVVGQQTLAFSNCYLGNTTGEIIAAGVENNWRDVRFSSCRFNNSTTGIGTIKGQSSSIDGLRLIMSGCSIGGAPLGLTINGGQSVQIDAMCEDIDDATGCIKLTGTISQKRYAVNATNCAAGVSDTATGEVATPSYEWEADYSAVKGAAVQTSATDTTAGALMAVGAFGLGSGNVPYLTDLTLAIRTGEYQVTAASAASGTLGGPEVAAWNAAVSVVSTETGTLFFYQRVSTASARRWVGFRVGSTGAVTWTEILTTEWEADYLAVKNVPVQSSATDVTAGALMTVGAFGIGSENVPYLTDLTLDIRTGEYQVASTSAASGTLGGPEVLAFAAYVRVSRAYSGLTEMHYRRASAANSRQWIGHRATSTGSLTWHEIVTSNSLATSIGSTPRFVGQHAVVAGEAYIAVGTSSSADWKKVTP